MATRAEIIRADIDGIVRELNLLDDIETELNPRQARRLDTLRARETGLRAELVAEIAAQGNSSHSVGCFFLTPCFHQFTPFYYSNYQSILFIRSSLYLHLYSLS